MINPFRPRNYIRVSDVMDMIAERENEVADIFRKFMEWTHKGAFYFRNNFTEGWTLNGVSHNSLLNDDELFDYWWNNIKDK